ncbi:MAG: flagellar hook assembly protein FlgD [Gammaproteobacteria bacterium]|nr:flagellar hook assembly protein FlgD [Gammaproteobacteria bacterium]
MSNHITNNPIFDGLTLEERQKEALKDRSTLDQEDFLRLMITQMRNQNPTKPDENGDFIAQMAQFSTVSGLNEMKESVESLAETYRSNQALEASMLVGRHVMIPAEEGYLPPHTEGQDRYILGAADLDRTVGGLNIEIKDRTGQTVRTIALEEQQAGLVRFAWDGLDAQGNPVGEGNYTISATTFIDGKTEAVETLIVAPVDSVTLGKQGSGMKLNITGYGELRVSEVREIL